MLYSFFEWYEKSIAKLQRKDYLNKQCSLNWKSPNAMNKMFKYCILYFIISFFVTSCQYWSPEQNLSDYLHVAEVYREQDNMKALDALRTERITYLDSVIQFHPDKDARFLAEIIRVRLNTENHTNEEKINYFISIKSRSDYKSHHPYIKFHINLEHFYCLSNANKNPNEQIDLLMRAASFLEPDEDIYAHELARLYEILAHEVLLLYGIKQRRDEWRNKAVSLIEKYKLYPSSSVAIYNKYYNLINLGQIEEPQQAVLKILDDIPNPEKLKPNIVRFYELLRKTYIAQNKTKQAQDIDTLIYNWHQEKSIDDYRYYFYLKQVFTYETEILKVFNNVEERYDQLVKYYESDEKSNRFLFEMNVGMIHYAKNNKDVEQEKFYLKKNIDLFDKTSKSKTFVYGNTFFYYHLERLKENIFAYDSILNLQNKNTNFDKVKSLEKLVQIDSILLERVQKQSDVYKTQSDHLSAQEIEMANLKTEREKERVLLFKILSAVSFLIVALISVLLLKIKRSNKTIINQKKELEIITNSVPIGLYKLDETGKIVWINESTANFYRIKKNDFSKAEFAYALKDSRFETVIEQLALNPQENKIALEGAVNSDYEEVSTYSEGMRWTKSVFVPLRNEKNEVSSFIAVLDDHTKEKQAELRLKEANENLSQFAAVAAHDLKAPLRTIAGFSETLYNKYKNVINKEDLKLFEFIIEDSKTLNFLIEDLLRYSKITYNMERIPVNLTAIITTVLNRLRLQINEAGAEINWSDVGEQIVFGHKTLLEQVFLNLLQNALKFRKENIPLKVNILFEKYKQGFLLITVSDNGIGIKEAFHGEVFKIFRKLHSSKEIKGSGIGLSTCKKIIKNLGGDMWFESSSGEGTSFFFTLPVDSQ